MGGFTLIEVLVSMTVLVLIIGLLAQLVNNTSVSILHSTKGMDNTQLSTIALDRIGNSIAGMVTSGSGTLVAYKNNAGSDGLAMITNGRVRSREPGNDTNIKASSFTDIRMGVRGYGVISTVNPDLPPSGAGGSFPSVPMLSWGDGTITWSSTSSTASASVLGDPTQALLRATQDVIYQTTLSGQQGNMLNFSPLSRSIFRFELSFLLSDGTTVSGTGVTVDQKPAYLVILPGLTKTASGNNQQIDPTPLPRNKYFVANEAFTTPPVKFPAGAYPLAFSAATSDTAADTAVQPTGQKSYVRTSITGSNLYVRAVIVGIASLDATTQKILTPDQLTLLGSIQVFPKTSDTQTPAQTWSISDSNQATYQQLAPPNFPLPVLQNIRITQRYYYVN